MEANIQVQSMIDNLVEYFKGEEWRTSIAIFVEANCDKFRNIDCYSHIHHNIWKDFQEIVEQILDQTLQSYNELHPESRIINSPKGLTALENAIDLIAKKSPTSPKDSITKQFLKQLVTYDDFEMFAQMMSNAADVFIDKKSNISSFKKSRFESELKSFGFTDSQIKFGLNNSSEETNLEDLVILITSNNKESNVHQNQNETNTRFQDFNEYIRQFAHIISKPNQDNFSMSPLDELQTKFAAARDVLEVLDDGTTNKEVVTLIEWAKEMLELYEHLQINYDNDVSIIKAKGTNDKTLIDLYFELERTRRQIDDEAIVGKMLSDEEILRMFELDRIASTRTEDEQLLHNLIGRYDEIQREINGLHQRIAKQISYDKYITRHDLEELYLYLKEKVASGIDLSSIADELFNQVYSKVSQEKGSEVVTTLLDMHVLEDEQYIVKKQINSLMSIEEDIPINDLMGSLNVNEILIPNDFADLADSKDNYNEVRAIGHKQVTSHQRNVNEYNLADRKALTGFNDIISDNNSSNLIFDNLDLIGDNNNNSLDSHTYKNNDSKIINSNSEDNKTLLDEMKIRHKTAVQNLKLTLDHRKQQSLLDLRQRLQLLKQKKQSNDSAEIIHEINQCNHDIDELTSRIDLTNDEILSSFKQLCINEMKSIKENNYVPIDQSLLQQKTSKEIIDRHLISQKKMLESIELERKKQKSNLLNILLRKKDSKLENKLIDSEIDIEIEKFDKDSEEIKQKYLKNSQESLLLSLSTIFIDTSKLLNDQSKESNIDGNDDDNYLSDIKNDNLIEKIDLELKKSEGLAKNFMVQSSHIKDQRNLEDLTAPTLLHQSRYVNFSTIQNDSYLHIQKDSSADSSNNLNNLYYNQKPIRFIETTDIFSNDKERIIAEHVTNEKELIESLQFKMHEKKKLLQTRLEKKKLIKSTSGITAESKESDEENEINEIEYVYDKLLQMVKQLKGHNISQIDIPKLLNLFDHPSEISDLLELPVLPTVYSSTGISPIYQSYDSTIDFNEDAKRISKKYSEEQQKLDLVLKLQQTRQKQNLQRKLFERRNIQPNVESFPTNNGFPKSQQVKRVGYVSADGHGNVSKTSKGMESRGLSMAPFMRK